MILFFSGVFAMIGLALLFGAGYLIGQKNTPKTITRPPTQDEDAINQQKAIQRDFRTVMNYSVEKAIERKKVT